MRPPPFSLSSIPSPFVLFPLSNFTYLTSFYLLYLSPTPPPQFVLYPLPLLPFNFPGFMDLPTLFSFPYLPSFLYLFHWFPLPLLYSVSPFVLCLPLSTCSVVCYTDVGSSVPSRNSSYTDSNQNP